MISGSKGCAASATAAPGDRSQWVTPGRVVREALRRDERNPAYRDDHRGGAVRLRRRHHGSPWATIGDIGDESGVDPQVVLELMLGPYEEDTDHPWHRLERGEIEMLTYAVDVQARAEAAGLDLDFNRLRSLMVDLPVHHQIVERIRSLRIEGFRTGLITNNVKEAGGQWRAKVPLDELFDVVVDSSAVGMRKPNPAIFHHTLAELGGVAPANAVFLDDHPGNVAGAQAAGLQAILVDDPDVALVELDTLLAG